MASRLLEVYRHYSWTTARIAHVSDTGRERRNFLEAGCDPRRLLSKRRIQAVLGADVTRRPARSRGARAAEAAWARSSSSCPRQ
eukprot:6192232-Pleurochrysis_carterae.AAC.3